MRQLDVLWIPLFCFGIGVLFASEWNASLMWGYVVGGVAFLLLGLSIWIYPDFKKSRWFLVGCVLLGVGMILGNLRMGPFGNDMALMEPGKVTLVGTLGDVERIQNQERISLYGKIFVSEVIHPDGKKETKVGVVHFQLNEIRKMESDVWHDGLGVRATGNLQIKEQYRNPGPWLTWQEKSGRGVFRSIYIEKADSLVWYPEQDRRWIGWATQLRNRFLVGMERVMPEKDRNLLRGILFGGRLGISEEAQSQFAVTGLTHILSVSGTHLAVIFGSILWVGSFFRFSRFYVALFGVLILLTYSLLSGFPAPVVRSFWMAFGVALGMMVERDTDGQRIFSLTLLGMLLWEPRWLYDVSFQLSAAATAGLVLAAPYLERPKKWSAFWQGPILLTLGVQIFSLPLMAAYFQSISLLAFLGNLILLPLFEGTLIFGMLGCLASFFSTSIAEFFWISSSLLLGAAMEGVRLFERFPWALLSLPSMDFWDGMVYYIGLGILIFSLSTSKKEIKKWGGCSGLIVLLFLGIKINGSLASGFLEIHFLDVGQGDAILIRTPQGKGILLDTGGRPGQISRFDIGSAVVSPYLWRVGVRELELIILSHEDEDHRGGLDGILARFPVKEIWGTPLVADALKEKDFPIIVHPQGYETNVDGVRLTIQSQPSFKKGWSQVVEVAYGEHTFLFTGDMDGAEETQFLEGKPRRNLTGLKVGHHGSKKGTGRRLLDLFSPEISIISVGESNRYGHPGLGTLARLREAQSKIYRTDMDGRVLLKSDGRTFWLETMKRGTANGNHEFLGEKKHP